MNIASTISVPVPGSVPASTSRTSHSADRLREHAASLRRHLSHCHAARGRWFAAGVFAESVHSLLAPRFVTTVAAVSVGLAVVCGWI